MRAAFLRLNARILSALAHRLAANLIGDEPALLRRDARVTKLGYDFHDSSAPYFSPPPACRRRPQRRPPAPARRRGRDLAVARVALERARRRELAELVTDHVLGDEHRHVLPAVMHGQIVRPTMSGRIIERRDHVLIGRRSLVAAAFATLSSRWTSMNGPFLIERDISSLYRSSNYFCRRSRTIIERVRLLRRVL